MRILHTADWHLGHTLHRYDRYLEHQQFLDWLLDQVATTRADALLIAGDVFDTANPPSKALRQWYDFLAQARTRFPALDLVVIGGNHDSAPRLDAPASILDALNVTIIGGLSKRGSAFNPSELVVPLHHASGAVAAWVAAVPFVRLSDVPRADSIVDGVRHLYQQVLDVARAKREPHQALMAMGHCYLTGTTLSELSERKVLGGNQHALPTDLFGLDVAYVALGHLHLAQQVGDGPVYYAGSPIALSLAERDYPHQVRLAELSGASLVAVDALRVPRAIDLIRIPEHQAAPLDQVLDQLAALPPGDAEQRHTWPLLEVHVQLPEPEPTLRAQVDQALTNRRARLALLKPHYTGTNHALGDAMPNTSLTDLDPTAVFTKCWLQHYPDPPPAQVMAAFEALCEQVQHAERDSA